MTLKSLFSSCTTVKRFASNGRLLPVMKASFSNMDDVCQILEKGVCIGHMYIKPMKYQPIKQPTRCFNCNKFGHTASFCKSKTCCAKCSEQHKTNECTSNNKKCCNCNMEHPAFDKNCQVFLEHLSKVNFL